MVSYVEGLLADFSPEHLLLLGARLVALHKLSEDILSDTAAFPDSRLHPRQLPAHIPNLSTAAPVPHVLRNLYQASVATITTLQQAPQLPITLLHGDCWPHNAVFSNNGQLTLLDWDCSGLGPAILDVGYLLLTCHLGEPQLPAMHSEPELIAAVVHGYCQQRQITTHERAVLREAVHFEAAPRVIADNMLANIGNSWHEDVRIQKALARFAVCDEITEIAQTSLHRHDEGKKQP